MECAPKATYTRPDHKNWIIEFTATIGGSGRVAEPPVAALKPSREWTKRAERCALDMMVRQPGSQTRLDVVDAAIITRWRDHLLVFRKVVPGRQFHGAWKSALRRVGIP